RRPRFARRRLLRPPRDHPARAAALSRHRLCRRRGCDALAGLLGPARDPERTARALALRPSGADDDAARLLRPPSRDRARALLRVRLSPRLGADPGLLPGLLAASRGALRRARLLGVPPPPALLDARDHVHGHLHADGACLGARRALERLRPDSPGERCPRETR